MGTFSLGGLSIATGFAVLAAFGATACGTGTPTCPDIGWFNEFTVVVDQNMRGVDTVQVCIDDNCAPGNDGAAAWSATNLITLQIRDPATGRWIFTTGMETPPEFTVRITDAFGDVLVEQDVQPAWERVGGTQECGGPEMATVVIRG